MTQADVQDLQNEINCLVHCMAEKQLMASIVQLLWSGSGGGGAGGFGVLFDEAAGAPPVDGSILKQGYIDTDTGVKYINTNWPDTAAPVWEAF